MWWKQYCFVYIRFWLFASSSIFFFFCNIKQINPQTILFRCWRRTYTIECTWYPQHLYIEQNFVRSVEKLSNPLFQFSAGEIFMRDRQKGMSYCTVCWYFIFYWRWVQTMKMKWYKENNLFCWCWMWYCIRYVVWIVCVVVGYFFYLLITCSSQHNNRNGRTQMRRKEKKIRVCFI